MSDMITVRIAEIARKNGVENAHQLQQRLNIPPAMAAKLWGGKIKMIRLRTIDMLCQTFNCKPGQLLSYRDDPETAQ